MSAKSLWSKFKSPWPKKPLLTQFWAGEFDSDARFYNFVEEDEAYFEDGNHEIDGPIPLSEFAGSQGQKWYDHDFMEVGSVSGDPDPKVSISASWSQHWADEFTKRARKAGITPTHFIMVGVGRSANAREYRQFRNPRSVSKADFSLAYLGEIAHEDDA